VESFDADRASRSGAATIGATIVTPAPAAAFSFAPGLQNFILASPPLQKMTKFLGENVSFTVAPKTVSNEPIQAQRGLLQNREIDDFLPQKESVESAVERLKQLGFQINRVGRFGISASGPAKLVTDVLGIQLAVQARPRHSALRATQNFSASFEPPRPADLFVAPIESLTVKTLVSKHIDDVVFIPPPLYFGTPSATPPNHSFSTVDSIKIQGLLNVPAGVTGKGIKIALVDTGFFSHPYYTSNGFDFQSSPEAQVDDVGHGTAIAYNVFAVAREATVLGFKQTPAPQDALEEAADAGADIISCSWGWDYEQSFPILEATIRSIVAEGKITIFAAGNGEQSWPGSMREVLSIGGVHADPQGNFQASDFASGFSSNLYPGRRVLDGLKPKGIYIMMPCPPGCELDRLLAGPSFPDKDETPPDDGWCGASGTSSAAPQIAGVAALMLEVARSKGQGLNTDGVRDLLEKTAVPVQKGVNAQGFPAVGHLNTAVGYGLVDAGKAIAMLKVQAIS
jgi:serine protease AprX